MNRRSMALIKHTNKKQGANSGTLFPYASKREMYL